MYKLNDIKRLPLNLLKTESFNDFSDQLSFNFSCKILLISSVIIVVKQYFIKPISCYIPNDVGGKSLTSYIENYCWVEGTIPIKFYEAFPSTEKEWKIIEEKKILYYQWVPFILAIQAVLCYLPQLLWRLFYINNNGKSMENLISKANKAVVMDDISRSKEVKRLAKILEMMMFESGNTNSGGFRKECKKFYEFFILGKRYGAYLKIFYLFVKILYLFNSIGQIFLMQSFLSLNGSKELFFGTKILGDILNGKDWEETSTFPRIGYCLTKVRQLASMNVVVAQCSLPVNMLNEKVYVFLLLWMLVLSIVTSISIVVWICKLFVQSNKSNFLKKYLKFNYSCQNKEYQKTMIKPFENKLLKTNGVFLLRMVASNSGDLITAEIVNQLWETFIAKLKENRKHSNLNDEKSFLVRLKNRRKTTHCEYAVPNAPCLDMEKEV